MQSGHSLEGSSIRICYRRGFTIAFVIHSLDSNQSVDHSLSTHLIARQPVGARCPSYVPFKGFIALIVHSLDPIQSLDPSLFGRLISVEGFSIALVIHSLDPTTFPKAADGVDEAHDSKKVSGAGYSALSRLERTLSTRSEIALEAVPGAA